MRHRPVQYYRQTSGFSCGAASLVMAMNALRDTPITRSFEFELWRDGTMIGTRGMCQWGLSVPALRRGVPATVVSEGDITFPVATEHAKKIFTDEELEVSQFAQRDNRARAEAAGVAWEKRAPGVADVRAALARGAVPVLLVDLHTLSKGADTAPHWVVVAELAGESAVLNDPDPDGPGIRKLSWAETAEAMDVSRYGAKPTLVVLGP